MRFSLTTWNINSVRLRIDIVAKFLKTARPDVLCLQETKCPTTPFRWAFHAARLPACRDPRPERLSRRRHRSRACRDRRVDKRRFCGKNDAPSHCRDGGLWRAADHRPQFLRPAGGDQPDPSINEKFAHKLSFLDELQACMGARADTALGSGGRPQHRAARDRRVVAQAAVESGQPHAGRDGEARSGCERRAAGSMSCDASSRPAKTLHVVELSLAGLDGERPRPPPGSHLGERRPRAEVTDMHVLKDARSWARPSDHVPVIAAVAWTS